MTKYFENDHELGHITTILKPFCMRFVLDFGVQKWPFRRLQFTTNTVLGSTKKTEQRHFSMLPSILTFFDLILGFFFTFFFAPMVFFCCSGKVHKKFLSQQIYHNNFYFRLPSFLMFKLG